jgi:hypothetical protein
MMLYREYYSNQEVTTNEEVTALENADREMWPRLCISILIWA